jgi:hypothetical protein
MKGPSRNTERRNDHGTIPIFSKANVSEMFWFGLPSEAARPSANSVATAATRSLALV